MTQYMILTQAPNGGAWFISDMVTDLAEAHQKAAQWRGRYNVKILEVKEIE